MLCKGKIWEGQGSDGEEERIEEASNGLKRRFCIQHTRYAKHEGEGQEIERPKARQTQQGSGRVDVVVVPLATDTNTCCTLASALHSAVTHIHTLSLYRSFLQLSFLSPVLSYRMMDQFVPS